MTTNLSVATHGQLFDAQGITASKTRRERGERIEDNGNGTSNLYIDGKFVAIVKS